MTIVISTVSIPVVFKLAAELEYVIALHHRQIIAEYVVFSVPISLTCILRAHTVGNECAISADIAANLAADL